MAVRSNMDEAPGPIGLGQTNDLVPLFVTRATADALGQLQEALRTDATLYRRVELMLARMQVMTTHGPLTDCLRVLVGTSEVT